MRFSALILPLILTCVYLTLAQGSYEDCCLRYVRNVNKRTRQMVISYREQVTDGSCNIPAIVFTLKRGRKFCADPNQKWVKHLMEKIEKRNSRKRHNWPKTIV
ncbi:C-C motif chemokine 20-like [Megalops cyprinoides]|uniref:C-C motif chemokine 20-like n=1 Tax=Megalops cyprinoides TaxID=118141 RepID=UPI001863CE6C|nr:C-C motif chemokine 20-like [Megalops cyprinoides]